MKPANMIPPESLTLVAERLNSRSSSRTVSCISANVELDCFMLAFRGKNSKMVETTTYT